MLYPEPRFVPGGDCFIEVELGDEMSFDLNVRVHALAAAIRAARIAGVVELIPELASLLVSYDPDRISYADAVREIQALSDALSGGAMQEMTSRVFHVPLLYYDPWTAECVDEYRKTYPDKTPDPELMCEQNGLADRAALQRVHCASEYWVAALGFWPGLCSLMPLDPRSRLNAPKYNPPRGWTPKGAIGLGGGLTCIYPDRTPGGYQIFARTPMPTWDRHQRLGAFRESPALFRPGDRVRFVPIQRDEYDFIEEEVNVGRYVHPVIEYQTFSVPKYQAWLQTLGKE
ncbi:allophanate hydrolase subunit 1 [Caballeronia sordidicola]|uniref:Allophanate hydrolase subunit 1 n=1 Tax=Caballeronia sordidicola TaxID=196367 RepID=A0A158EN17_CABSO|nr:carboxyltransferase domain-containing protein [Caballeronia sordidicola]SAL08886.1 allophanate hydrolase subunit 1 [Caballeronia sordidicola]